LSSLEEHGLDEAGFAFLAWHEAHQLSAQAEGRDRSRVLAARSCNELAIG
jgi:hypothetical protein